MIETCNSSTPFPPALECRRATPLQRATVAHQGGGFPKGATVKEIPLTRGKMAVVDDEDYHELNRFKWNCSHYGYAVRGVPVNDSKGRRRIVIYMHRCIMSTPIGMHTDHKNGDKLDNRKGNLRICTHAQNQMNRAAYANNTSGFKGVSFSKHHGKFLSYIRAYGKIIRLGYFADPSLAYKRYCEEGVRLHGDFFHP